MSIEVNGVTLPDIPSEVLEQYPYAVITQGDVYQLWVTDAKMFFSTGDVSGAGSDMIATLGSTEMAHYGAVSDGTSLVWQFAESTNAVLGLYVADTPVVWSNYDILEIIAYDATTGEFTYADEPYFPSSVSDPNYYAPKSWYDGMARQVMRLTGTSDKLTTDEMLAGLKSYEGGLVLAENERIYQVGTAASTLELGGLFESSAN